MPNILKRFTNITASKYVFPDAADLPVLEEPRPAPEHLEEGEGEEVQAIEEAEPEPQQPPSPVDFAQVQAEAILEDARRDAERLVQEARERGAVIDATFGRKTKTVIIMDSGSVVLSAIMPETVAGRFNGREDAAGEGE